MKMKLREGNLQITPSIIYYKKELYKTKAVISKRLLKPFKGLNAFQF